MAKNLATVRLFKINVVAPLTKSLINEQLKSTACQTNRRWKYTSIEQFGIEKTPITNLLWHQRLSHEKNEKESALNSSTTTEATSKGAGGRASILEKISSDSRIKIEYDFNKDRHLRDIYVDAKGFVGLGKLFEDLDAFAGNIAFLHCDDKNSLTPPRALVTASIDQIKQSANQIPIKEGILLSGQIAWVGRSSLDIIVEIHSKSEVLKYSPDSLTPYMIGRDIDNVSEDLGAQSRLLSSMFTYVARDRITGQAVEVNKFKPTTDSETALFQQREQLALSRRKTSDNYLQQNYNNNSLSIDALTALIERGCAIEDMPALAHPNAVLMKATSLENSLICQPQNGNTSGRVFGGFLIHRAFDLALATAYTFSGSYPHFKAVDKIMFKQPVEIGDLVRLKSRVVYTSDDPIRPTAQVEITCQIVKPEKASSFVSNTFNFTFGFQQSVSLRRVLPSNFEEATLLVRASKIIRD